MSKKHRYFCQMNSQHVRMRVAHSPVYEQIAHREPFDGHTDEEFESMRASLAANLLKLLFRGDRPLA